MLWIFVTKWFVVLEADSLDEKQKCCTNTWESNGKVVAPCVLMICPVEKYWLLTPNFKILRSTLHIFVHSCPLRACRSMFYTQKVKHLNTHFLFTVFQWPSFDENNNRNNFTFLAFPFFGSFFWELVLKKVLSKVLLCLSYFLQLLFF